MGKVCVINVVGLTPKLAAHAPRISALGKARPWKSPIPAVTCTAQATMLTGMAPSKHGIVGNGWLFRDTGEVRLWQQSNALIQGEPLYARVKTAKMFWWFNQGAPVEWSALTGRSSSGVKGKCRASSSRGIIRYSLSSRQLQ